MTVLFKGNGFWISQLFCELKASKENGTQFRAGMVQQRNTSRLWIQAQFPPELTMGTAKI